MKINIGILDRVIRITIAIVFVILFITGHISGTLATILLGLGVVFSVTGMLGFCPLYLPLKINTKKSKSQINKKI